MEFEEECGCVLRALQQMLAHLPIHTPTMHCMVDPSEALTISVLQPRTTIQSSIKTLPVTFNKRVLHQKYVLERRSMRQISAEFASSKTAVQSALIRFGIPIRETGKNPHRTHNLPFGKRCVNARVVTHKGEQRTIESVLRMHAEGLSNCAIARVLTEMKISTKQQGKAWHPEMVRQILIRRRCRRAGRLSLSGVRTKNGRK